MTGRVSFGLLLALLVAIGCLRPVLPLAVRESWGALVLGLAVAAFAVELARWRRSGSSPEGLLFALFPFGLAACLLQPQRIASDGIFYFAPLHSAVVDFDLDFDNEYRVLGAESGYFQRTETGRLPNNYSVGPALFWLPMYVLAHVVGLLGAYRPTGFGYPYFTAVAVTTNAVGFAGVVFVYRLVRGYFEPVVSLLAALLVWLATFHVWYMVFEPSMSHALAMTTVSGFFLLTHRGILGGRAYALAGAAAGVVALVRWQNVVFVPVALFTSYAIHGRPKAKELLCGALAFLVVFSPQLLYWKALYGEFFLVPQGGGYIDWASPRIEEVLLSSRHGLLTWSPLLWLALAGIPGFVRRTPAFGLGLLATALLALYVNASVYDWWAGASFGSRRFDGVLPAFGLGLGMSLSWLAPRIAARPRLVLGIAVAPFVLWNVLLMNVYFDGAIPPDGPASFRQAASDGIELVYRETGYPFAWPGSLKERLLRGVPLPVYDLSSSRSVSNNVDIRMGDTDALHLGRGWSLVRRGREQSFRHADPAGADVFVALAEPARYEISVWTRPGESVQIALNDVALAEAEVDSSGRAVFIGAAELVLPGMNRLRVRPSGREPVGVYRIRFQRGGE